jgi:serine/threonine-protein kinase
VPPTVVVRRWSGRADPPSVAELGRRTGAGLAVYGSLLGSGPDSVRLRAALLDVDRGRPLGEWELADATDRMDRLTDSLTVLVLEELGRTRPIGAVRRTGLHRTSAPALKAFLQGEQHYRQGRWDSALVSYRRAIAADSGLAPALRRAGQATGWLSSGFDSVATAYTLRAAAFNHGLPARDSLLLVADSLLASLLEAGALAVGADSAWMPRLRRLLVTLEYATANWPDDPEAWFTMGEFEAHLGPFVGRTRDQRLHAFDLAIALDSGFAPSYFHQVDAAVPLGPEAVRRYLDPYFRLGTKDVTAAAGRLFLQLLDSPGDSASVATLSHGVPDAVLLSTLDLLGSLPDSVERVVSLIKVVASRSMSSSPPYDQPFFRTSQVGRALMSRGHLRAAGPFVAAWPNSLFFGEAILLGAVPADLGVQVSGERLAGPVTPRLVAVFPWWTSRRDTVSLRRATERADSAARSDADPNVRSLARYAAASAAAYGALSRADTAGALTAFLALPADGCPACVLDRLTTVQLLEERRRDREAWQALQGEYPFSTLDPTAGEILWVLLRARVGERLGYRERAIESYAWVAGMWRNADAELQPYVQEARQGIERLTAE